MNKISVRRASALALATASSIALVSTPASAADHIVDTDQVSINGGASDFGSGLNLLNAPMGSGTVTFDRQETTIVARVRGTVYVDQPAESFTAHGCARIRVRLYSIGNLLQTQHSKKVCRDGLQLSLQPPSRAVSVSVRHPSAYRVKITTQFAADGVHFVNTASQSRLLGVVNGVD